MYTNRTDLRKRQVKWTRHDTTRKSLSSLLREEINPATECEASFTTANVGDWNPKINTGKVNLRSSHVVRAKSIGKVRPWRDRALVHPGHSVVPGITSHGQAVPVE